MFGTKKRQMSKDFLRYRVTPLRISECVCVFGFISTREWTVLCVRDKQIKTYRPIWIKNRMSRFKP